MKKPVNLKPVGAGYAVKTMQKHGDTPGARKMAEGHLRGRDAERHVRKQFSKGRK